MGFYKGYLKKGEKAMCETDEKGMMTSYEFPTECFKDAPPSSSVYHHVEVGGSTTHDKKTGAMKSSRITIGEKMGIRELIGDAMWMLVSRTAQYFSSDRRRGVTIGRGVRAAAETLGNNSVAVVLQEGGTSTAAGTFSVATATGGRSGVRAPRACSVSAVTGEYDAACADGINSAAVGTGSYNAVTVRGISSVTGTTGCNSLALADGMRSSASTTGDGSLSESVGTGSIATSTGNDSRTWSAGQKSVACVTGDASAAEVSSESSLAVAWGRCSSAKGMTGSFLLLSEWDGDTLKDTRLVCVDGTDILPNTAYILRDGKVRPV